MATVSELLREKEKLIERIEAINVELRSISEACPKPRGVPHTQQVIDEVKRTVEYLKANGARPENYMMNIFQAALFSVYPEEIWAWWKKMTEYSPKA